MSMLPDPESKIRALEAELADLRASPVVVWERCEHGWFEKHPFGDDCPMNPGCDCICPGGRLADGVKLLDELYIEEEHDDKWFYVIPARLIEGDA